MVRSTWIILRGPASAGTMPGGRLHCSEVQTYITSSVVRCSCPLSAVTGESTRIGLAAWFGLGRSDTALDKLTRLEDKFQLTILFEFIANELTTQPVAVL
jgi:hypothetical protein